ncbi:MAG: magnesium transporter [Oscillospiraceae bacterium]|nr:magnesium transporter [Oscillospiraceae bacterium]
MDNKDLETLGEYLLELLDTRQIKLFREQLEDMNEHDIASFISQLPRKKIAMVFRLLPKSISADVFANLDVDEQHHIIECITDRELGEIIEELFLDDAVDLLEELPASVVKRVMHTAASETRALINQYLEYPDNSAGSIMTAEFVDLKLDMSVREAFTRIRRIGEDKETIYTCFVVSGDRKLEGVVTVKDMLLSDEDEQIRDIMDTQVIYVTTTEDQEDVSEKFSEYDLLAVPVVDKEHRLVGIVTVDDIIDVLQEEATEDFDKMAGITPTDKPYTRAGVMEIWKSRIPWLMLLMISATFTSLIILHFENALATVAVLAGFIPMLMGTGGNSGSQSSTAVIRSLSLGDIAPRSVLRVLWKELRVAVLCAGSLAVVNYAKMFLIDRLLLGNSQVTPIIALVVSLTLVFTVILAKLVGSTLPLLAEKVGIDPAVMASPLISTLTDAMSLLIYFTVATAILHI